MQIPGREEAGDDASLRRHHFVLRAGDAVPVRRPLPQVHEARRARESQINSEFSPKRKCISNAESGLLIEVAIFFPSNVVFLSSLWTKLAEIL